MVMMDCVTEYVQFYLLPSLKEMVRFGNEKKPRLSNILQHKQRHLASQAHILQDQKKPSSKE